MPDIQDKHYRTVIEGILKGEVVLFLGAGVNLTSRALNDKWHERQEFLPDGAELAAHLARTFGYPETNDLARVSQAIALMDGSGPLYQALHRLFDRDYPPTLLHKFLASIPAFLREKGHSPPYQLIITTNYDDLMERAFYDIGQEFDVVSYVSDGEPGVSGKFVHRLPDGTEKVIEKPNEYRDVSFEKRPVILKIHGAVNRRRNPPEVSQNEEIGDSYVITEDHYIDYLTRADLSALVPVSLARKLATSYILFMGYGLRDWNLRVILHRIISKRIRTWPWWAIQLAPDELDRQFWKARGVEILDVGLDCYIRELKTRLQALPIAEAKNG